MKNRADPSRPTKRRRRWPAPSLAIAGVALFVALGGSAVAANSLIRSGDIATGAVTSRAVKDGTIEPIDLGSKTLGLLAGSGTNGVGGANGASGAGGVNGANGPNGANGVNGIDGENGTDGVDGVDGTDGEDGTDGVDGTIKPLSATAGVVALPAASEPTTVVTLPVPAGSYVVLAKTQLSHTGAGDSVYCVLRSGATPIDRASMETLPALASIPVSLQAVVTTTTPTSFSFDCDVKTADGAARFNSLIAIPTA
jgi:hypothetical protein